ncbi:peroxiredoxin [Oxynema sp. CENA135]|nr:peroxiredoxin [Oxynema sp. CENA135]
MTLQIGDRAPDFSLCDGEGNLVSLADFRGRRVILYFYPRDNTPGCTKEACGFRDLYPQFQDREIVVLGISTDDRKSHSEVPDAHCYAIERGLLSSPGTASRRVDFRLPPFGLTFPPRAVDPLPESNIRKPSFLILIAALMSLSCLSEQ